MKYLTMLKILDEICSEAPNEYKSYKAVPSDEDSLNQARSKAFIHLYLKVKCGIANFKDRHMQITDGGYDGGLDAYYIDREKKKLYLIQSKFRMSAKNFEAKSITAEELVRMEIKRIVEGYETDSNGNKFNKKIKRFQKEWSEVRDQAHYEYIVLILGNLTKYNDKQIRQLVENSRYEIFDYKRSYDELVFPLCTGTYFDPKEITIKIELFEKGQPILEQKIETIYGKYDVRIIFVPTQEVARILSKYKNSMLQYNPRNYLTLSSNKVNQKIRDSILGTKTNEFAILNNGITMIADSFQYTKATGKKNTGQVIITKPAIINGGQTAYTLSEVYEQHISNAEKFFGGKEVLLKVIIIEQHNLLSNRKFIEEISDATNQQTKVGEADRRSNDEIQVEIQRLLFENFGYFFERKKGEFYTGLNDGYLRKDYLVNRVRFIRAYLAFQGKPAEARSSGEDALFKADMFKKILGKYEDFRKMLFSSLILENLRSLSRKRKHKVWGSGLRYGKMSIIAAIGRIGVRQFDGKASIKDIDEEVKNKVAIMESKWKAFERWVKEQRHNREYLEEGVINFDNYYKGKTVNVDIKRFFGEKLR